MKKVEGKLILIENNEDDWRSIQSVMTKFVEVYPDTRQEFIQFKKLLSNYAAQENNDTFFNELKQEIDKQKPTIALVDVNLLDMKGPYNKTGHAIAEKMLSQDVHFRFLTSYARGENDLSEKLYFRKNEAGQYLKKNVIRDKVLVWLSEVLRISKEELQKAYDNNKPLKKPPLWERAQVLIPYFDLAVTVIFYISLIALMLGSCCLFYLSVKENHGLINIAEYSFLLFLPFMITMGFFVFYKNSLKITVVGEGDPGINFDKSVKLMMLSKKLFISSLVSYLFIKLIEYVAPSSEHRSTVTQGEQVIPFHIDYAQVGCIIGIIAILICYYIYINKHTKQSATEDAQN